MIIVRKRKHGVSVKTKQNISATRGAKLVPIGILTIFLYNFEPSIINILSKR